MGTRYNGQADGYLQQHLERQPKLCLFVVGIGVVSAVVAGVNIGWCWASRRLFFLTTKIKTTLKLIELSKPPCNICGLWLFVGVIVVHGGFFLCQRAVLGKLFHYTVRCSNTMDGLQGTCACEFWKFHDDFALGTGNAYVVVSFDLSHAIESPVQVESDQTRVYCKLW